MFISIRLEHKPTDYYEAEHSPGFSPCQEKTDKQKRDQQAGNNCVTFSSKRWTRTLTCGRSGEHQPARRGKKDDLN